MSSEAGAEPHGPLDRETEERLRELGGEALLRRLWRLYLEVTPSRLETLAACLEAGDAGGAGELAHVVRSSTLTLGAAEVAEHAAELERLAPDIEAQRRLMPRFTTAERRLRVELERRLRAPAQELRPTKL